MPTLDRTRALAAGLAKAIGLDQVPPDDSGGYHLTVGEATDIFVYGGDDETILLVAPVATLPRSVDYGLALYLLRANMFDSDMAPFQFAADAQGGLIFWGRLRIVDFDGTSLSALIDRVAERVREFRAEVEGPAQAGAPGNQPQR